MKFICRDCGAEYVSEIQKERCEKCEKAREKWIGYKLEKLNDYIVENLGMELIDTELDRFVRTI